jgi:hypothetical protein
VSKSRKSQHKDSKYGWDEPQQRREQGNFDRRIDMRKERALRTGNLDEYLLLDEDE